MNAATKPVSSGAAFGNILFAIIGVLALSACGFMQDAGATRVSLAPPPPQLNPAMLAFAGTAADTLIITADRPLNYTTPADLPAGGVNVNPDNDCALRHRFDRSAALAYNFADNKSRLALNMSLSEGTVEKTMLRFTHKFQPYKSKKERCLYNSPVQGLIGSITNELVLRKDHTVWYELKAKNFRFWD